MNQNVIETKMLTKKHGSQYRVRDLELRVPQNCVYGFLGPNGAGKSTTIKLLLGLLRPTSGEIYFFGQKMNEKNRLSILRNTGSLIEKSQLLRASDWSGKLTDCGEAEKSIGF